MATDPSLHCRTISPGWECMSESGNGGENPSQTLQMTTWTQEQEMTMELAKLFPSHLLTLLPGFVARKASTTVMVLAKTEETATEKMMQKAVCRRRQVTFLGLPMKRKEDKKESKREMRRM